MGNKIDNVISLYLDGVRDGHVLPAAEKYLTETFTEHSEHPGQTPGRGSFVDLYEPLVARYHSRAVWPLRGFEDGSRVFLHSYQTFGADVAWVSMDVFDTDADDQITGRWSVRLPLAHRSRSGRSQIDGAHYVDDRHRTKANKRVVTGYLTEVLAGAAWPRLDTYVDTFQYAEHDPEVGDGAGLVRHLERCAATGEPIRYQDPEVVVGCGNFVATVSAASRGRARYRAFDVFRLDSGRIVEHWSAHSAS